MLFDIRSGAEVEIINDPQNGWEMSEIGLTYFMPLNTRERVVNTVLSHLVRNYRHLSAALGNSDMHDVSQLRIK